MTRPCFRQSLVCSLALAVTACTSASTPPPGPASGSPTYYKDVEPILAEHCTGCHAPGALAPFELTTYESAAPMRELIASATASRVMPPFGVDASGACQTYRDARWLSDEEIARLGAWASAGAPLGDPADARVVTPPAPDHLEGGTSTLEMVETYTPNAALSDDYRCFVIDSPSATDAFLTAYEVHPGEPRTVHHILLYASASDAGDSDAAMLDALEDGPGYTCFGGPRIQDFRFLAGWAPGVPVTRYPEGTGLRVYGGHKTILQVHYNLQAGALPDKTSIDVVLAPSVGDEAIVLPLVDLDLELAPRMSEVETINEITVPSDGPARRILGVFPHMHLLGRTLRVERERAGETTCVTDVPRWDFHWQQFYFYETEIDAQPLDVFRLRCTYDTTERTDVVRWGEGTADEMCLAGFYLTGG